MAKQYLDKDGLLYFWQKIKNLFAVKADAIKNITRSGTTFTATRADGTTFTFTQQDDGETNQNAFSNVKVGSTTIAADSKTDTLELVAGTNVTLTPDATNDKITIAATSATYTPASAAPLMDGTAAVGTSTKYAREDHVHPSDTTKVDKVSGKGLSTNDFTDSYKNLIDTHSGQIENIANNVVYEYDVGHNNGICPLNASGKVDSSYLPSYVDDVVEAYARSGQTALSAEWLSTTSGGSALTPETGKIYVLMADSGDYAANSQFRWGGSAYVKLADGGVSNITNAEIDTIVAS